MTSHVHARYFFLWQLILYKTRYHFSSLNRCSKLITLRTQLDWLNFFPTLTYDFSSLGVDIRSKFQQASTQTKANLGFGETFTNLIGASPNLAIRAWQPNQIESNRSNFTHCKRIIYSYNPIALYPSRLIVYRCPYRVSLCLTHHPHPALLSNHKVIRAQRPYSISTRYLGIWLSDVILLNENAPWLYLQKGTFPFWLSSYRRHPGPGNQHQLYFSNWRASWTTQSAI